MPYHHGIYSKCVYIRAKFVFHLSIYSMFIYHYNVYNIVTIYTSTVCTLKSVHKNKGNIVYIPLYSVQYKEYLPVAYTQYSICISA